jgi:hypothetical protein
MPNIEGTRSERIQKAYELLPIGAISKSKAIGLIAAALGIQKSLAAEYIDMLVLKGQLESSGWFIEKKGE